jgi:predicted XRE-type DNA-binding protein
LGRRADTPEEATNLRLRSELMDKIEAIVRDNSWTQAEAAAVRSDAAAHE